MFNLFYLDCDMFSNRKRKLEEMEDELFETIYEDINKNPLPIGEVIVHEFNKRKTTKNSNARNEKYSDELVKFSLTLHGYSCKEYNFVRDTLQVAHSDHKKKLSTM